MPAGITPVKSVEEAGYRRSLAGGTVANVGSKSRGLWQTDSAAVVLLVALGLMVYVPVLNVLVARAYDYRIHLELAQQLATTRTPPTPHFLYQALVIIAHRLVWSSDFVLSSLVVVVTSQLALGVVLYARLRSAIGQSPSLLRANGAALAALALMLVSPITIFTWFRYNLYNGYIGLSVYHNPTMLVLKPLAVLLFFSALRAFEDQRAWHRSYRIMVTSAACLLTVLATLAKPNYTLCLVPACALVTLYRLWRREVVAWWIVVAGILVPALLVLGWQYSFTYQLALTSQSAQTDRIVFAPLLVYSHYSSALLPKFLLSIAFPLLVYGVHFADAKRDLSLNLAWLAFAIGAAQAYLLAETGPRRWDGNFLWSAQITLFLLFVVSVLFLVGQVRQQWYGGKRTRAQLLRLASCVAVLAVHLISGLLWYALLVVTPDYPRW